MMNSIAPIWDGNETWLVLGGLGLFAAFPLAFAIIIPAVYFPILVMLLALVFRGVAFEFRFRDAEHRTFWDHAFCYGSGVATFAQGVVLGAFIQGFKVEGRGFAGTLVRFLDAVLDPDRHRAAVRLWPARRRLADPQDRGRHPGAPATMAASAWSACSRPSPSSASGHLPEPGRRRRAGSPGRTSSSSRRVPIATAAIASFTWRALGNSRAEVRRSPAPSCSSPSPISASRSASSR